MRFGSTFDQIEPCAKRLTQPVRAVSGRIQSAALLRAIRCKRANDHTAANLDTFPGCGDVTLALVGIDEEVEHRPIMPEVVTIGRENSSRDVRLYPGDPFGCFAEPLLRDL